MSIMDNSWLSFIPTTTTTLRLGSGKGVTVCRRRPRLFSAVRMSTSPEEEASRAGPADESDNVLSRGEQFLKGLQRITSEETALSNPQGLLMSHEIVQFDSDGLGPRDRYVYVEELDCIGCTACQTTAIETFFMEPELGRARVFDQTGDVEEVVEEAIDTCPVNCIYYVSWEDLVKLERMRRNRTINNWARLVGGQDVGASLQGTVKTDVMDSGIIRCQDCPGRGCATCPMFGVGENPEYLRKKKIREAHRRSNKKERRERRKL